MDHDLTVTAGDVRLVPLAAEHAPDLLALIDDALWAGMVSPAPRTVSQVESTIADAHRTADRYAFAVLDADTGQVRGATSLYDVNRAQQRAELGHTYYGRPWWGGSTNPACKLALLTHAFETWELHRVALRADARNARSIAAIRRLGAQPEGVLRGHRVAADGSRGDTAYFSILAPEWPAVRDGLLARL
jgi:RimJ/RimL family protein N-acetyltransferase